MAGNAKEMESILRLAGVVDPSLKAAIQSANREVGKLNKDQSKTLMAKGKQLQKIGKMMTATITLPVIALGTAAVKAFSDLDTQQRAVQASLGVTNAEMERLSAGVDNVAAAMQRSGKQGMSAMAALVDSSYSAADSLRVLPSAMLLAEASNMDTAEAANYLASNMQTFGAEAWEAATNVDQLARATKVTDTAVGTSFEAIGDAVKALGDDIHIFKGGTTEVYSALAVLADAGIEGSDAASALKSIGGSDAMKRFEEMKISALDAETGGLRPLRDIFGELQDYMNSKKWDDLKIDSVLKEMFGANNIKAARQFMDEAGDTGNLEAYRDAIWNSDDALSDMAATINGGLAGEVKTLKAELEALGEASGKKLVPMLTDAVSALTDMVEWLNGLDAGKLDLIIGAAAGLAAIGPVTGVVGNVATLMGAAGIAGPSFSSVAAGLSAIAATPVLPLLVIAGTIGAVAYSIKGANDDLREADLAERFGEVNLTVEQINALASTVRTGVAADIEASLGELDSLAERRAMTQDKLQDLKFYIASVNPEIVDEELNAKIAAAVRTRISEAESDLKAEEINVQGSLEVMISRADIKYADAMQAAYDARGEWYTEAEAKLAAAGENLKNALADAAGAEWTDAQKNKAVEEARKAYAEIAAETTLLPSQIEAAKITEKARSGQLSRESILQLKDEAKANNEAAKAAIDEGHYLQMGINRVAYDKGEMDYETMRAANAGQEELRLADNLKQETQYLQQMAELTVADIRTAFGENLDSLSGILADGVTPFMEEARAELEAQGMDLTDDFNKSIMEGLAQEKLMAALDEARGTQHGMAVAGGAADSAASFLAEYGDETRQQINEIVAMYQAAGEDIPEPILEAMDTLNSLETLVGNTDLWDTMHNSMDLTEIDTAMKEAYATGTQGAVQAIEQGKAEIIAAEKDAASGAGDGAMAGLESHSPSKLMERIFKSVPEGAVKGIESGKGKVKAATSAMASLVITGTQAMLTYLKGSFLSGWGSAWSSIANKMTSEMSRAVSSVNNELKNTTSNVPGFAEGGTVTKATFALVGEDGVPETMIPHRKNARSLSLLMEAAEGIGFGSFLGGEGAGELSKVGASNAAASAGSGGAPNITFAPNIIVQGGGSGVEQAVQAGLDASYPQFVEFMNRYFADRGRVAYAPVPI